MTCSRILTLALSLLALVDVAGAQAGPSPSALDGATRELMRERDREWIHPGQPLQVRGIGQEDNDFRAATPLLASGRIEPVLVDEEALYRRALAMYSGDVRFDGPPPALGAPAAPEPTAPVRRARAEVPVEEPDSGTWGWLLLAVLAVAVVAVVRQVRRHGSLSFTG